METPIWSYRVPTENRELMKRLADALRRDASLQDILNGILAAGQASSALPLGPFKNETAAVDFIRDRLTLSLDPHSIWLFGSRARGDHRPDSDFDILVVLRDELGAKTHDYRYALEPVLGTGLPCDIVPTAFSEFENSKNEPGTIAYAATHEGRCLYRKRVRTAAT
jgi:predicted nucleotidyltransferase